MASRCFTCNYLR